MLHSDLSDPSSSVQVGDISSYTMLLVTISSSAELKFSATVAINAAVLAAAGELDFNVLLGETDQFVMVTYSSGAMGVSGRGNGIAAVVGYR